MAQVEMPEKKPKVDYNDRPAPVVNYDVTGSVKPKTGIAKWFDDIWSSLMQEVIKPTLKNLLYDVIVRSAGMGIYQNGGAPSRFTNYAGGGNGAGTYNPNAAFQYNNRFNANDNFARSQMTAPKQVENWRGYRFRTKADAEIVIDRMKQKIFQTGSASILWYSDLCGQNCDWTLGSYGWRDFSNAVIQYCMDGRRDNTGKLIPFMIIPPQEGYLGD